MLQVLSWNAYNHNTPPPMSNISSYMLTPDTPRMSSPVPSKMTKRKRTSEGEGELKRQDSGCEKGTMRLATGSAQAAVSTFSPPPPFQLKQQPSDGLPTPLLSPTVADTENKDLMEVVPMPAETESAEVRRHKTTQVVTQQINLEILVKHNELRLIDQEIAKCQVSLEQLRRCTEIPFPATQMSQHVSNGTGPSLRQKYPGQLLPTSPAPWGVTDGPYSRHYASWLLSDSTFDGGEPDSAVQTPINGKRPAKGRHGRPSVVEDMQHAGMSSRSQRGSLQSLGSGFAPPKEKSSGPLILKRSSDGKMVKLKCLDCGRHNFGSAQGFINHCRIGHSRTFPSHDAAAESCGEPVEYDANGAMMGVEPTTVTPAPTNVHTLIRSVQNLPRELGPTPKTGLPSMDGSTDALQTATSPDFTSSNVTPFLSALVQHRGLGLDLQGAVTDAKTKTEMPESDVEMSEDEEDIKIPESGPRGHPQVAGTRGLGAPSKAPSTSPFLGCRIPSLDGASDFGHPIEPSPTTDSNQAPSLIDDDEEYEAHSPASTPASDLSDEDLHVCVRDDDEPHVELSRPEFQPSCAATEEHVTSSPARRPSAFRKETERHEEKHVSFDNEGSTDDHRSKRRKITK